MKKLLVLIPLILAMIFGFFYKHSGSIANGPITKPNSRPPKTATKSPLVATKKDLNLGDNKLDIRLGQAYQAVYQDPFIKSLLQEKTTHALKFSSRVSGKEIETFKFQHFYKGLEVMGSMTFYHVGKNEAKVRNVISRFDLDINPKITAKKAAAIAKSVAGNLDIIHDPILKILPSKAKDSAKLIYFVDLSSENLNNPGSEVLIDAQTGKLIANISKMETLAPIQVSSAQQQGVIVSSLNRKDTTMGCLAKDLADGTELNISQNDCNDLLQVAQHECQILMGGTLSSSGPVSIDTDFCKKVVENNEPTSEADESSINALINAKKVLSYYKEIHGRDSFDNKGSTVINLVHAGIHYANAAWVADKNFMLYGDGDGKRMGDMTKAVDIAGHEMTHGVISHTAKLAMMGEPGALNEAYADFFGKMIAQDGTWVVGASVSIDKTIFPGVRDLENPKSLPDTYPDQRGRTVHGSYPSTVSEKMGPFEGTVCGEENDRCWVHHNSTIPSHASYLIFQAIGKAKTEQLYYLTLTQFLTSQADFQEAATSTMEACSMLINQKRMTSADCLAAKRVFLQVGML